MSAPKGFVFGTKTSAPFTVETLRGSLVAVGEGNTPVPLGFVGTEIYKELLRLNESHARAEGDIIAGMQKRYAALEVKTAEYLRMVRSQLIFLRGLEKHPGMREDAKKLREYIEETLAKLGAK